MPELGQPVPMSAHHIRKGTLVFISGHPCKITETATSKTGKHGHAKITFAGVDIFTGKKYSGVEPGHAVMMQPPCVKTEYLLCDLDEKEGTLNLMADDGSEVVINLPAEFKDAEGINTALGNDKEVTIATLTSCVETAKDTYVNQEVYDSFKVINQ